MDGARRWAWALGAVCALSACTERTSRGHDDDDGGGGDGSGANGAGPTSVSNSGSGAGSSVGGGAQGGGDMGGADQVCARWNADRAALGEGSWSGSVGSCNAGDISAEGRDNALKLVNLYRFLAKLPEVTHDAGRDAEAQACALMMHANGQLSHTPPTSWACYTSLGASGAGTSNIATSPGVSAVDLYLNDFGNASTMGHRRWILSNSLGPIGLGSTSSYSCLKVIGGDGDAGAPYTAFPTPGFFPYEALNVISFESIDVTGWTIQSDGIDLSGAVATVSDGGESRPVQQVTLAGGYGSAQAINLLPQGWVSEVGHSYHVSVSGVSTPIEYDVTMVGCQ